jgi:hypothetical protein
MSTPEIEESFRVSPVPAPITRHQLPIGSATAISLVARSSGKSWHGNQYRASSISLCEYTCGGSPAPVSDGPPVPSLKYTPRIGRVAYSTRIRRDVPVRRGSGSSMRSFRPSYPYGAVRSSSRTPPIVIPTASNSIAESPSAASSKSIVTEPSSACSSGLMTTKSA